MARKLLCLLFCGLLLLTAARGEETLLPPLESQEIRDMEQVGWTMQLLLDEGWQRFETELTAEDMFIWGCLHDHLSLVPAGSDWRGLLLDLLTMESAADYRAILRRPYAGIIDSLTGGSRAQALAVAERIFHAAGTDRALPYRFAYALPRYEVRQDAWMVQAGDGEGRHCRLWLKADLRLDYLEDGDPWRGHWGKPLTPTETEAALAAATAWSETVWPGALGDKEWIIRPKALEGAAEEPLAVVWSGDTERGLLVCLGAGTGRVYYSTQGVDAATFLRLPKNVGNY